jgi:GntR family transcriptional regulator
VAIDPKAQMPSDVFTAATLPRILAGVQFHLDQRSGVPMYLQIVQQVKEALRLGLLDAGDQLPTVREVVAETAINPNTVAKAYRELERDGLVFGRPGRGTFIAENTLAADSLEHHARLRHDLLAWLDDARRAGMGEESILALVSRTVHEVLGRRVA